MKTIDDIVEIKEILGRLKREHSPNIRLIRKGLKRRFLPFDLFYEFNTLVGLIVKESFGPEYSHDFRAMADDPHRYGDLVKGFSPELVAKPISRKEAEIAKPQEYVIQNTDGTFYSIAAQLGRSFYDNDYHMQSRISDGSVAAHLPMFTDEISKYYNLYDFLFLPEDVELYPLFDFDAVDPNGPYSAVKHRVIRIGADLHTSQPTKISLEPHQPF